MAGFWEGLAVAYGPAAESRRKQVPLRFFVSLALCACMAWRQGFDFLRFWAVAYLVAQLIELLALRRFQSSPRPASTVGFNLVADFLMAVVFGCVAIPLWQIGTPAASAAATLLLTGSIHDQPVRVILPAFETVKSGDTIGLKLDAERITWLSPESGKSFPAVTA